MSKHESKVAKTASGLLFAFCLLVMPHVVSAQTGPSCGTDSYNETYLKVSILKSTNPAFDPQADSPQYDTPAVASTVQLNNNVNPPPSAPIFQDLLVAWNISPPFFKTLLCNLDAVFINTAGCDNNNFNTYTAGPVDEASR